MLENIIRVSELLVGSMYLAEEVHKESEITKGSIDKHLQVWPGKVFTESERLIFIIHTRAYNI